MTSINNQISLNQSDIFEPIIRTILLFLGSFLALIALLTLFKTDVETLNTQTEQQIVVAEPVLSQMTTSDSTVQRNAASYKPLETVNEDKKPISKAVALEKTSPKRLTFDLKHHSNLKSSLIHAGLDSKTAATIINLAQLYMQTSNKARVDKIQIDFNNDRSLDNTKLFLDNNAQLLITHTNKVFHAALYDKNNVVRLVSYSGIVNSDNELAEKVKHWHAIAIQLNTIFHDDLNIKNLPLKTKYSIVVEENQNGAKTFPKLLGAKFTIHGKQLAAVLNLKEKRTAQYVQPNGQSFEKAVIRIPVKFDHISSPFDLHRFHPILHILRPHYGVDLAAHYGSPILASSNGLIAFAGYENGFGNVIHLKLNDEFSFIYGHLSHLGNGIHTGQRVKEGQVIAYVGSSGLATGAHLHYEVHQYGKPVNPLTVKLPGGQHILSSDAAFVRAYARRIFSLVS